MKKRILNRNNIDSKYVNESYDTMKEMLNLSRGLINEQDVSQEYETAQEEREEPKEKEEKTKEYTVSGGKIIVHGVDEQDLVLTQEEQTSFQETMDDFVEQVSDMAEYHPLNIYKNNVEWSGDLLKFDVRFYYSIAEVDGTYIGNANMIKVDPEFLELLNKLKSFFKVFEAKWAKILASRRTTEATKEEGLGDNELSVDVETDSGIN
tara:strand:+ start:100 stop:720 length:621 start_codon:yes stop_codon:yes gene_type:complete